jgi:methenyltetrahydromethanopterin cyclohydrolase
VDATDDELEELAPKVPSSASSDYGEPFGALLEKVAFDFYKLDPMLFSPAEVRITSTQSGRTFAAGGVNVEVLERSFWP